MEAFVDGGNYNMEAIIDGEVVAVSVVPVVCNMEAIISGKEVLVYVSRNKKETIPVESAS